MAANKKPTHTLHCGNQGNDLAKCQRERTVPVWLSADHGGTPEAELVVIISGWRACCAKTTCWRSSPLLACKSFRWGPSCSPAIL